MPQLKDFSAWINIEDKTADEFNVEVSNDGRRVTCWIVSEVGKKFVICIQSLILREDSSLGPIWVDGRSCQGIGIQRKCMRVSRKAGFHTSPTTMKPFIFSMLQLTDDDLLLNTSAADALGEISIQMWRTRNSPATQLASRNYANLPGELQLHERSKKLTSHHIKFGEEVSRPATNRIESVRLDEKPIVTFTFKYRPLGILKANGIVPSTIGQQRPVTAEPEAEDNARQDVEEDQNASTHRIEASENRSAVAESDVGAIKQEEGSRKDVEFQNASANRIMTSEKRPATAEPEINDIKRTNLKANLDYDNVFPDRINALEEELNNLKRMYQQSTANKAKRVKVEASSSKNVIQPGEVIDLT